MNRFCSIFSQLLQVFSSLGVSTTGQWRPKPSAMHAVSAAGDQFVAMLFCQLGRAHSLREICGGLASCEGKLHHLGIASPKRSTLSYANKHRPWQLYEKVFYRLLDRCLRETEGRRKRRFRFKNPLLSQAWTRPSSICAHNCLTGLIFAEPRGPSNCIYSWTTTVTFPSLPTSPRQPRPTSPWLAV